MYIDEEKKSVLRTLNRLLAEQSISDDEYFAILAYVVEEKSQVVYAPPQVPQTPPYVPWTTWHGEPFKYEITCQGTSNTAPSRVARHIIDKE